MKVKAKDLKGAALDWAVARYERPEWFIDFPDEMTGPNALVMDSGDLFSPSTDPSQAVPIMDREGISVIRCDDDYGTDSEGYTTNERIPVWAATVGQHGTTSSTEHQQHEEMYQIGADDVIYGSTMLEAGLRCYVASKLSRGWNLNVNAEIDIPEALC